jgi:glycosyltransferase involved in cell wall biosynthesis
MPPLRLTFLITDLHLGGSPLMLRDLATGLQASGGGGDFEVTVISLKPLPPSNDIATPREPRAVSSFPPQSFGFDSSFVISPSSFPAVPVFALNLSSPLHLPRARRDLARLLQQSQTQILYSILIHANLLAALTVPLLNPSPILIQSIHTLQPRPRWHWSIQRFLAPRADALIAPSQPILDRIAHFGRIRQSFVIPNGIDVDRFANAQALPLAARPWPAGAQVLGYVGRFDPVKRLDLLIHTLKVLHQSDGNLERIGKLEKKEGDSDAGAGRYKGGFFGTFRGVPGDFEVLSGGGRGRGEGGKTPIWHLALVGYGPDEARLRQLTTSLHLTPFVHFLGPTRTPEQYYKAFNCLCLPSSVEGFGLVLAEALAAGIPVVAPETPVTAQIVRTPEHGHLVPSPTPESLAHAIQEVTANPPTPESLQSHIRTHFSTTLMVQRHAEILKKIAVIHKN